MIVNDQARVALEVSAGLGGEPASTAQVFLAALTGAMANAGLRPDGAVETACVAVQRFKELTDIGNEQNKARL